MRQKFMWRRRVEGKAKRTLCPLLVDQQQEQEWSRIGLSEVIDRPANDGDGRWDFN